MSNGYIPDPDPMPMCRAAVISMKDAMAAAKRGSESWRPEQIREAISACRGYLDEAERSLSQKAQPPGDE